MAESASIDELVADGRSVRVERGRETPEALLAAVRARCRDAASRRNRKEST